MKHTFYLSMEFGLATEIKSYAGGLGILAGDTLKSVADLNLPISGVTLLYTQGYFKQKLDAETGEQIELPDNWDYKNILTKEDLVLDLEIAQQNVHVEVWSYEYKGHLGSAKIYFLNADNSVNDPEICKLYQNLYPRDLEIRLQHQLLLALGSSQLAEKLVGIGQANFHLNESHAGLLIPTLAESFSLEEVKSKVIFTTHTPIASGHQEFSLATLKKYLPANVYNSIPKNAIVNEAVNLTRLCLLHSKTSNGVSRKHAEVTTEMFPEFNVDFVTNGIHPATWASPFMQEIFDAYLPLWRQDSSELRNILQVDDLRIQKAHQQSKIQLFKRIKETNNKEFAPEIFTIGFGRRAAYYKRNNLLFQDLEKLRNIAKKFGGLQLVFSGKSYPDEEEDEQSIIDIFNLTKAVDHFEVVYLENYNMETAKLMLAGCDLWLNNPIKPLEACGTSGMKAALNGMPSLSVLDGWWIEGHLEGITGWSIGEFCPPEESGDCEVSDIYDKLENKILPLYTNNKQAWLAIQKQCIAINAAYFNTERMLKEYLLKGYSKLD